LELNPVRKFAGARTITGCGPLYSPGIKVTSSKPAHARIDQPSSKRGNRMAPYMRCTFQTTASAPTCCEHVLQTQLGFAVIAVGWKHTGTAIIATPSGLRNDRIVDIATKSASALIGSPYLLTVFTMPSKWGKMDSERQTCQARRARKMKCSRQHQKFPACFAATGCQHEMFRCERPPCCSQNAMADTRPLRRMQHPAR